MTTLIVWRKAKQPKRDGFLKHEFKAEGEAAQSVLDWLTTNNTHGLWRIAAPGQFTFKDARTGAVISTGISDIKFEIWALANDAAAVKQADSVIAMFKLTWANAPECEWRQH